MSWKKILIWGIVILITGFSIELGIKSWIKNSLPSFIKEKNDTPYNFNYSDVSYSLFARKMTIEGISISPKIKDKGIYTIKTNKIIIHGVHFLTFLSRKDLIADQIVIEHPDITAKQDIDSIDRKKEIKPYALGNSLQIGDFVIKQGELKLIDSKNNQKIASLKNLNLTLSGVVWDIVNKEKRIPITYEKAKFSIDAIFYQFNDLHHLELEKIRFENGYIEAKGISVNPNVTEQQFKKGNSSHKSLMNIKIPTAKIKDLDWGYTNGLFYVNTSKIEVDSTHIYIMGKPANPVLKKNTTTTYIDRIIPFNLKIDTIQILKSKLNLNNHFISDNINILISNINNKVNNEIIVERLKLYDNFVNIYQRKSSSTENQNNFTYLFDDILKIKDFSIQNSQIKYYNPDKVNVLSMSNIYYSLHDITINTLITNTQKTVPFTYSTYNLDADSLYYTALKNYSFKTARINLTNDVFSANRLEVIPKLSPVQFARQNSGKNLFKLLIKNINIPQINWKIQNDKFIIQAPDVSVNSMNAAIYQNKTAKSQPNNLQFKDSDLGVDVTVNNFNITNSSVNIYDARTGQILTSSQDLNLKVNTIVFNDNSENTTLGLPFSFSGFTVTGKNIFHDLGYHTLQLGYLRFTQNSLLFSNLIMKPKENRKALMKKKGIDAYTINLDKIEIPDLNLGLPNKEIQFTAPLINIHRIATTIHQYDIPDSDYIPVYKPLFSKKLRDLKFKLQLGEVNLKNSYLSYEEESVDKGTGKIYFTNINAQIKNINSGYKVSSLPDVIVDFKSNFMYSGQFSALWKFNVLNQDDRFSIKGKIQNLPAEKVDMFIKPYLQVSANGLLDEVIFGFYGNNDKGNGTFGMNYKDLKVTVYKKNGKEERKLLSNLANLAVKGDTKDSLKVSSIKETERKKDKSFFNFLWNMALNGLKNTLLRF